MSITHIQWILVVGSSIALLLWVPRARTAKAFYEGLQADQQPGFWLLLSSLVISWLFAKSLTNAANLGLAFGLVGGLAYATYYLSFGVAGKVLVDMRTKGGFGSIHEFLAKKFGRTSLTIFSVLIAFRLFNEVWSNTMVIGSYFGETGTKPYLAAVVIFTLLTLAYAIKGGMGSSILTDVVQMVLFGLLLVGLLGLIQISSGFPLGSSPIPNETFRWGEWTLAGGLDLLCVALLQSLSYPFHDPVLTDRAFISEAGTTRRAFYWSIPVGAACILLFSLVGVFARAEGMTGEAAVEVSKSLGTAALLVVNLIMVTSAASTLDSTFSSWSKLLVKDLKLGVTATSKPSIFLGRWAMLSLALIGTVPVFFGPEVLSATTISGLMVVGLAPVFLFWRIEVPRWTFVLTVGGGLFVGLHYALFGLPQFLELGTGKYAGLLGATLIGTTLSFLLFAGAKLIHKI